MKETKRTGMPAVLTEECHLREALKTRRMFTEKTGIKEALT